MKRTFIISLLVAMVLSVQAQRKITIEGTVTNVEEGTIMVLLRNDGLVGKAIATDTIQNGKFHFKVEAEKEFEDLSIMGRSPKFPSMSRQLYATPGCHIYIQGNDYKIFTWKVNSNIEEQQDYDSYFSVTREDYDKMQELMIEVSACFAIDDSKTATNEEKKAARQKVNELYKEVDKIHLGIYSKEMDLMQQKSTTKIWMNKLFEISRVINFLKDVPLRDAALALYNKLTEEQKKSEQGQTIIANLFPPTVVKVGDDMADTDLYDLEGNLHHLTELKGKYILFPDFIIFPSKFF